MNWIPEWIENFYEKIFLYAGFLGGKINKLVDVPIDRKNPKGKEKKPASGSQKTEHNKRLEAIRTFEEWCNKDIKSLIFFLFNNIFLLVAEKLYSTVK